MPWMESNQVDQKVKFIARLLDGEKMAPLCREFNIARKTGYQIWEKYKRFGQEAFLEQKRTPYRYANKLPVQIEMLILELKKEYPGWGAPKIREKILRRHPDVKAPAISTIHAVLDRHGLVKSALRRKRYKAQGTPLSDVKQPNDLWCADYKGEFMLGDQRYCYPLTITDYASRFLLNCEALSTTREEFAFEVFTNTFKEFGLPRAIRTDNGTPFASGNSLYGLTKLSVWWLRLGIALERIKPGHPEQNGRHERMHLTLKKETTRPPGSNLLEQQEKFDSFITEFNEERPHQGIGMKYPSELYKPSPRLYTGVKPLFYPFHDKTITVTACGRICERRMKVSLSTSFAGQDVGIKEVEDGIWVVSFLDYDLGYFDEEGRRVEPVADPFGPKVLPMSPE
ncbi:MAG: integrase core domain-containing protein [Bdellovibrionota bacterium]